MAKIYNTIVIVFDDPKDRDEVLECLKKKTEITWNSDTKKAMLAVKKDTVLVSKSVYNSPSPIKI